MAFCEDRGSLSRSSSNVKNHKNSVNKGLGKAPGAFWVDFTESHEKLLFYLVVVFQCLEIKHAFVQISHNLSHQFVYYVYVSVLITLLSAL